LSLRFRVLGSGSGGNASLVEASGTRLLLDAGLGPRELLERLQSAGVDPAALAGIFLSHEHGDHAKGAASFSRKWGVPLFGTRGTYAALGLGALDIACYRVIRAGESVQLGELSVQAVGVPHDAAEPVAFVVTSGRACLGHATDLGHFSRPVVDAFRDCDALLVESNYDPEMLRGGPYPWSLKERILSSVGHLSNGDVARYLTSGLSPACQRLVLAHVSQNNNHPELVRMSAEAALRRRGRMEVQVTISEPDGTSWLAVGPPVEPAKPKQLRLF
jgi:phosphoribosyl 1,2-cyclic phosphodiesterase